MCQILCLTSHDPAKRDELILDIWKQMAVSEKDGYGAAWFTPDGTIGYHKRRFPRLTESMETPKFVDAKKHNVVNFGHSVDLPSDGGFLIIHGRKSTNDISLANTHPMLKENVALIHNGVVRSFKYSNKAPGCTCDSEKLLIAYLEGGVDEVELQTEGSYAFMCLQYTPPTDEEIVLAATEDRLPVGKKALHIAKDNVRPLHCGVMAGETYAIGTTEALLEKVDAEYHGEFKNHTLLVFSDKSQYEMTEYKSLPYAQRNVYRSPAGQYGTSAYDYDNEGDERTHYYPNRPASPASSTFPQTPAVMTSIDEAYSEAERLEIERLEKEAIIAV